ncbi:MAG: hypothetical protein C5B49_12335 [Bdellovibrio sp.]|nr:MAG: hypothetical protein C5B49_12335 [Bdellovibrio sp.]
MEVLYRSPVRVYVVLLSLAVWGVWSGLTMPISLFPNSSQPDIVVQVPFGDLPPSEFLRTYGELFEGQLKSAVVQGHRVEKLTADYREQNVRYHLLFQWGTDDDGALKEIQTLTAAASATWPEEIRLGTWVNSWSGNGELAVSFYSGKRSLDELYQYLKPIFAPELAGIRDAEEVGLWNPERTKITVSLNPEKMATLMVFPSDIEKALIDANRSLGGGKLSVGDDQWTVEVPSQIAGPSSIAKIPVKTRSGQFILIQDVASVRLENDDTMSWSFRTNGSESVILYALPKPGANVKRMSDEVFRVIDKLKPRLSKDVEYRILVNPSEFIDASIRNVVKEVCLAAGLAVFVLFLFIGSLKNVATAAIEIPLSIVLAFILMKITGVNINLISLGGLALSAGMNLDASVVVMENIFRHFEAAKPVPPQAATRLVMHAVREVRVPVVASTLASIVVFLPLLMTQGLTNAILGDLAKAVIYSHSMSAIVALVLVPTIRLQLLTREKQIHLVSPIEKFMSQLESFYDTALRWYLGKANARWISWSAVLGLLALCLGLLVPLLPRELIGRPETDWLMLVVNSNVNLLPKEFQSVAEKAELDVLNAHGQDIQYTFTSTPSNKFFPMLTSR